MYPNYNFFPQRRAQRKAERQTKRKAATAKAVAEALEAAKDEAIAAENADLAEEVGGDRSFDSLSSFSDDITTKVGSVGSDVTSGATVSHLACSFRLC